MVLKTTNTEPHLIPEKYPQGDLFVCDVADAVLKDFMAEMEHPFYSLSKKPDTSIREYRHNDNWLRIVPSVRGQATIYDKDILIYAISQVIAKANEGQPISKRIRINSRDFLMFTNRGTSGRDYMALSEALERIRGTTISTNIITGDEEQIDSFGLIESSSIRRKNGIDGRLLWVELTLSDWVFNAIEAKEVLTLHRDYFRLRKPLERRIYEIARKHCGQQESWKISLELLLKKSGSKSSTKKFKQMLKIIALHDHLPDYAIELDIENDNITFYNRGSMPTCNKEEWEGLISPEAWEKVGNLNLNLDKYRLEADFRGWLKKAKVKPDNPTALFINFAKRKAEFLRKEGKLPTRTR